MARRRREKRQVGRPFRPRAGQHEPRRREPAGSSLEDNRSPTALRADILRRLDAGTLILKSKPVSDQPGSSHDYDQRQSIFNEDATAAQLSSSLRPDMSFDLRPGSLIPKACGLDGHDGRSQEEYRFWRSEFCGVFAREIIDSAYKKTVRDDESTLKNYKNGTGLIYGEILESLIDDIIDQAQITSTDLFVDLGSGYGNVVVSVALKTGCEARGVELRKDLFGIAENFRKEVEKQAEEALFSCGRCKLVEGDFLKSTEIDKWIEEAHVIFVNGVKFDSTTNNQLAEKLLKMKDGARLVSLHDWIEIKSKKNRFDHKTITYGKDSVSWTGTAGQYHIWTVVQGQRAPIEPPRALRERSKTV